MDVPDVWRWAKWPHCVTADNIIFSILVVHSMSWYFSRGDCRTVGLFGSFSSGSRWAIGSCFVWDLRLESAGNIFDLAMAWIFPVHHGKLKCSIHGCNSGLDMNVFFNRCWNQCVNFVHYIFCYVCSWWGEDGVGCICFWLRSPKFTIFVVDWLVSVWGVAMRRGICNYGCWWIHGLLGMVGMWLLFGVGRSCSIACDDVSDWMMDIAFDDVRLKMCWGVVFLDRRLMICTELEGDLGLMTYAFNFH